VGWCVGRIGRGVHSGNKTRISRKNARYHPDKVATRGATIRESAERKSKEINIAFAEAMRANGVEK
jgi:preprotein translocase subunit Sec63